MSAVHLCTCECYLKHEHKQNFVSGITTYLIGVSQNVCRWKNVNVNNSNCSQSSLFIDTDMWLLVQQAALNPTTANKNLIVFDCTEDVFFLSEVLREDFSIYFDFVLPI